MVPDIWSYVVDLFAVFVCDNGTCCCPSVCTQNHSIFELDADDGGSRGSVSRLLESTLCQRKIPNIRQLHPARFKTHLWWLSNLNPRSG